tara:strand:+ start:331 stop:513 length:183 start_codon:yes stop_codon:yes gene_type:complete
VGLLKLMTNWSADLLHPADLAHKHWAVSEETRWGGFKSLCSHHLTKHEYLDVGLTSPEAR